MTDRQSTGREVVVDVREDLRAGREPFQKIMSAAGSLPAGATLVLYATFKPTPLLAVLKSQGFESEASPIEDGEWKVVFRRTETDADQGVDVSVSDVEAPKASTGEWPKEIVLDNRGLEPPEPMVRTLEAINRLQAGGRIVGYYDRRPMFLLPKLDQMGYPCQVSQQDDGSTTLIITAPSHR